MKTEQIEAILNDVTYPGWRWVLQKGLPGWFLRGEFNRPDRDTGETNVGSSRTEFLRPGCTEDEVVKTAWVLVKLTVEHEAMEFYTYKGKRVFDPHTPVSVLIGLETGEAGA